MSYKIFRFLPSHPMTIFTYYIFFTLFFSLFLSFLLWIIGKNKTYKLYKKHIILRKKYFLLLTLTALFIFWMDREEFITNITKIIFYSVHAFLFIGFLGFSIKKIREDKQRIFLAQKRRKAKEMNKK